MELLLITVYQNSFSVTVLQLMRQPMYLQVSYSYSGNYASDSICSSPDTKGIVESRQARQKEHHDKHSKLRSFPIGSPVVVRDFRHPNKWIPGVILRILGPVTYHVEIENGKVVKRHIDHLAHRPAPPTGVAVSTSEDATVRDNFHYPEIDPPIQSAPRKR